MQLLGDAVRSMVLGLSALSLAFTLGACATITRGSTTRFTIDSTPQDAHASTSNGFICESTPCTFRLPRLDPFTVTVSKPGYKTVKLQIERRLAKSGAAGFAGNVLLGGAVGATLDVTSGSIYDLFPNPANVTLVADSVAAPPATGTSTQAVPAPAPKP
jgi:hypothetical protein